MIGATRQSVSITLTQLTKEGVVATGRKEIAIDLHKAQKILTER